MQVLIGCSWIDFMCMCNRARKRERQEYGGEREGGRVCFSPQGNKYNILGRNSCGWYFYNVSGAGTIA